MTFANCNKQILQSAYYSPTNGELKDLEMLFEKACKCTQYACMNVFMNVCMYVCMYLCMYLYMYIYLYRHRERERAKTYHPIYVPVFAILYVYICIFTRLHVSINSTVWQEPTQNHVSIARRSCNLLFDRLATLAHGL